MSMSMSMSGRVGGVTRPRSAGQTNGMVCGERFNHFSIVIVIVIAPPLARSPSNDDMRPVHSL